MKVKVVEYNMDWKKKFDEEALGIKTILGANLVNVFHIGSTSVEGLVAKDVIDIMPAVIDINEVDKCNSAFEELGYEVMGEYGITGRRFFRKGKDDRTHHIHIFQYDNINDIHRHLAFRDYLKEHHEVLLEYASLKMSLAKEFPNDIESYWQGKDSFIKEVEKQALIWYWSRRE